MPYLDRLLASAAHRALAEKGKARVLVATVAHDDWCRLLLGKGVCNCNPTIAYRGVTHSIAHPNEQG